MIITQPIAQALSAQSDLIHFNSVYLLLVFVFNRFRPVVYCELVQCGHFIVKKWNEELTPPLPFIALA